MAEKHWTVVQHYKSIRSAAAITGYTTYMIEKCLNEAVDEIDGYGWERI